MTVSFWKRRKFLTYLGLGTVAASATGIAPPIIRSLSGGAMGLQSSTVGLPTAIATASTTRLPDFEGISQWLNSPPLTVPALQGKVVLVQFWTFSCINCIRTLPYVVRWHQQYAPQGLVVVGVHTPEFGFERQASNVQRALQEHRITYAVPLDNDYKTWKAYRNQYWPHLFLADRQGVLRYDHIGEGAYDRTEQVIRQLLS
uniref:Alkyl hydroperoxide reductase/ Thiol specific antioxidant/ Mal allergen n=1 Tax=Cyanothece sp. (strain PCC 7425 / ATCC 29141) TaxID=395961 RepID=B8HWQ6_CYAP4